MRTGASTRALRRRASARDKASLRRRRRAPVVTASASLSFQCLAMFSASGSSGLGALSSAWMLRTHGLASALVCLSCDARRTPWPRLSSTVRICSAGLHLSFRMSRHIRPSCGRSTRSTAFDVSVSTSAPSGRDAAPPPPARARTPCRCSGGRSLSGSGPEASASRREHSRGTRAKAPRATAHLRRRHRVLVRQKQLQLEHAACATRA